MTTSVTAILDAEPYSEGEEAAYNVASLCGDDAATLRDLLDALGLPTVKRRWTIPRAERRVISTGRDGFTVSVIRHYLPRRAHHLIPDTLAGLLATGLAEPDPAIPDGYRLTTAGRILAVDLRRDRENALAEVPASAFTTRDARICGG
jgi:hypothetical protein